MTALALLTQVPLIQAIPIAAPLPQAHSAEAPPPNRPLTQALSAENMSPASTPLAPLEHSCRKPKKSSRAYKFDILTGENTEIAGLVVIPEEFVISDKIVTPEKILSNTQKDHPIIQAYNDKNKDLMLMQLPTKLLHGVSGVGNDCFANYHLHYKEKLGVTEFTYKTSLLWPPSELISPPAVSSNYIVKVIKLLYDILEASITRFAIYHPHYKDKLSNPTRTFVCTANYLYFICNLDNILTPPACTTKPGLVMKKRKPPRTSLHLLSHQPPSLPLSLTFLEIRSVIFKYLAMLQYVPAMPE